MVHAQKPGFVFRRNGRVHLNRLGRQFSRLLAAEVCASAVVMLDTPCSEIVWRVLATHSIRSFPFTSPPVRHRVPSHSNWTLPVWVYQLTVQRLDAPANSWGVHLQGVGVWLTSQLSAGKRRSTTTLNYILAHNLKTEFKEEFYKRIHYMQPCRAS